MTITNFKAEIDGSMVRCSWDSDEDYSFLYVDAEMVSARPQGITTWSGSYVSGAVYQAVDSATGSPVPPATEPMPPRYLRITWNESSEPDLAKYEVQLNGNPVKYENKGGAPYTYRTPRLDPGDNTIAVIAIDAVGNKLSTVSVLNYDIEDSPPPVRSSILSQGVATNLTITLVEPDGWPTI